MWPALRKLDRTKKVGTRKHGSNAISKGCVTCFITLIKKICYAPEMQKSLKKGFELDGKEKILGKTTKIHDITCNLWRFYYF